MGSADTPFLRGALAVLYADPPPDGCPACGYRWATGHDDALDLIVGSPDRLRAAVSAGDAMATPPDGSWNAAAYLWHLTDLVRSWSERWVQLADAPGSLLVGWDPDQMADVRGYRRLPVAAATWAVGSAVEELAATTATVGPDVAFEHGDWGRGTVADALRWIGHEFHHHTADVRRLTGSP